MLLRIITIIFLVVFFYISSFGQVIGLEEELITKDVQIIKQPKPAYTDEARQKNVKGWVALHVTFLSNGAIGDVVYAGESSKKSKLTKYGLTEQAKKAVKKIEFLPAEDIYGLPMNLTKTVKYFYTIY